MTESKLKLTKEFITKHGKDISKAVAGDVVVIENGNPIVLDGKYSSEYSHEYVDGVVVIPSAHRKNNRPIIMSLHDMSLETPEQGAFEHVYMFYGGYNIETSLKKYKNGFGFFPVDEDNTYMGNKYPSADGGFYISSNYQNPSPYNADGSKNEAFFADTTKCYSDMDGEGNTNVIFNEYVKYDKEVGCGEIKNSYTQGHYPAVVACKRYHTKGTQSGEWYLPSIGELAYMRVRQGVINDTLSKLGALTLGNFEDFYWFWSSTEYSAACSWDCGTYDGYCGINGKGSLNHARAFHAL